MKNFLKWLVPNEEKFFDLLKEQSSNLLEASAELKKFAHDYNKLSQKEKEECAKKIKELERKGDEISRKITEELNKSFLTPFDGEDIHALINLMEDTLDLVYSSSWQFIVYKLEKTDRYMVQMADLLHQCIKEIDQGVFSLRKLNGIKNHSNHINSLEHDADDVISDAIAELFKDHKTPVEIIKIKDIMESLEKAVNKCETIADLFDEIVVKHG